MSWTKFESDVWKEGGGGVEVEDLDEAEERFSL